MPYRKTRTTRRYRRRGRYIPRYTKRRLIKSYLRKKARKGNTIVAKQRYLVENILSTDLQGGIWGSLCNPINTVNATTSTVTDWSSYAALYDNFRPCAVKLNWMPQYNTPVGQGTGGTIAVSGYTPIYHIIDYDDANTGFTPYTIAQMQEYENCKMFNGYRPWTKYMRVPKYVSQSGSMVRPGWYNVDEAGNQDNGLWQIRASDNTGNELTVAGTLRITFYLAYKNRK